MDNSNKLRASSRNINEVVKGFLGIKKMPEKLHASMQTIFIKAPGKPKKPFPFQQQVVVDAPDLVGSAEGRKQARVIEGRENAIFNALFLMLLSDTTTTKNIFKAYGGDSVKNRNTQYHSLRNINEGRFVRLYCLGISSKSIERIITLLNDESFNLFEQKLPLDIFNTNTHTNPLKLLTPITGDEIPWRKYMDIYTHAELLYKDKQLTEAMNILAELLNQPLVIPIAYFLHDKIQAEELENKQALDYLQTFLN